MHVFCGILLQQSELDTTVKRSILHMFVDTHNTGYYVNSYTTKVGIGMEEFMKHLRAGIARKLQEIEDEEAALRQTRKELGTGPTSLPFSKKAAQILIRINTSYTRAKHVGGAQLVFPMLFGHMCYTTHRCWNVWTKTAVWRAMRAWRETCKGQAATESGSASFSGQLVLAHRGKLSALPTTWKQRGSQVEAPDGTLYNSVSAARQAFLATNAMDSALDAAQLNDLLTALMNPGDDPGHTDVSSDSGDGLVVATNQLDDYEHRGEHPLLKDMTLYVYSMWVHRVEKKDDAYATRHVLIPFCPSYALAASHVQAISLLERVPKVDGFTMPPPRVPVDGVREDFETNAMFKSVLHRPFACPSSNSATTLEDPVSHYTSLHAEPEKPLDNYPWSVATAFSAAWHAYLHDIRHSAAGASRKLMRRRELETIWETQEMTECLVRLAQTFPRTYMMIMIMFIGTVSSASVSSVSSSVSSLVSVSLE